MHPLDAVSEPRRREILARLAELGEAPVGAIAETVDITRPAVSQHLKVLKDAGVVTERRSGRERLYRINADGLGRVRAAIEVFLINELDDLESSARRTGDAPLQSIPDGDQPGQPAARTPTTKEHR
ncbi:MAG: metalloregulator ArsR/SmtB family transcription factor [Ilumatobacteraceae bacterium]